MKLILLVIFVATVLYLSHLGEACNCPDLTTEEKVNIAERVFRGRVVAKYPDEDEYRIAYLVKVVENCKGETQPYEPIVSFTLNSSACAIEMFPHNDLPILLHGNRYSSCLYVRNFADVKPFCEGTASSRSRS